MIITREIAEAHSGCSQGLSWFDVEFPNGGEYAVVLEAAKWHDQNDSTEISNEAFTRMLHGSAKAWLMQGAVMTTKYQVFDPITGVYTPCNSLEEAKILRQAVIERYMQAHSGLFSVGQEVLTDEGNSIWNPLTEEQLK